MFVLDVDRGRADFRNIKAVVMEVDDSDNYKLRMEHGVYKVNLRLLSRNFLTSLIFDVPSLTVSLREGGRSSLIGLGQGVFKCS